MKVEAGKLNARDEIEEQVEFVATKKPAVMRRAHPYDVD